MSVICLHVSSQSGFLTSLPHPQIGNIHFTGVWHAWKKEDDQVGNYANKYGYNPDILVAAFLSNLQVSFEFRSSSIRITIWLILSYKNNHGQECDPKDCILVCNKSWGKKKAVFLPLIVSKADWGMQENPVPLTTIKNNNNIQVLSVAISPPPTESTHFWFFQDIEGNPR